MFVLGCLLFTQAPYIHGERYVITLELLTSVRDHYVWWVTATNKQNAKLHTTGKCTYEHSTLIQLQSCGKVPFQRHPVQEAY